MQKVITTIAELKELINSGKPREFEMDVAPDMVQEILDEFNIENRRIRQGDVDKYARQMTGGHWQSGFGVEPLKFNLLKHLFNGQHRLWAVFLSGKTIRFNVMVNLPVKRVEIQDAGAIRGNPDNSREITKEVNAICTYLTGLKLSVAEAERFHDYHRDAFDAVHRMFTRHKKGVTISPVLAEFIKAYYHVNHEKLAHFAEVLVSGCQENKVDRTIIKLRDQLCDKIGFRRDAKHDIVYWPKVQYALISAAQGKSLTKLSELSEPCFVLPGNVVEIISAR